MYIFLQIKITRTPGCTTIISILFYSKPNPVEVTNNYIVHWSIASESHCYFEGQGRITNCANIKKLSQLLFSLFLLL